MEQMWKSQPSGVDSRQLNKDFRNESLTIK